MPSRYFIGPSVKSNAVRASAARNFRELVQHQLEGVIRLHITQKEYIALPTTPHHHRLNAKDTTYLVACTYPTDEAERGNPPASSVCNIVIIDLDEDKKTGHCPAAIFARDPDVLKNRLSAFNFAAYTTASSTVSKPRMRIIVEADDIPLKRYPEAVRTVGAILGVSGSYDPRSEVPNQPMICPSLFADQDEDMDHPLIATQYSGRAFTVEDVKQVSTDKKVAGKLETLDGEDDGLEYLRAPLMGLTVEKVRPALMAINADLSYPEWFDMAAALRHQFQDTPEEAFELFDEWSQTASHRYAGAEETLKQWNAVRATPRGRLPVTIRTLIKRAADAGWSVGEVKQDCFDAVMDWVGHHASNRQDLLVVSLEKIAGLPMLSMTEEGILLSAIKKQLWETHKEQVTMTDLRKDLKKIRDTKDRVKDGAAVVKEQPWEKGWCYVTDDEKFFRSTSHQRMSVSAFNAAFGRFLLPTEEQLNRIGKEANEGTLNTPIYQPSDYILNHRRCLVVDNYDYDPSQPKSIYTEDANGVRLVNTYRRSYPKPDTANAARAGAVIQAHLANLIAEPEYQRVILDYIAHMVQFPGVKIRWCPLIQGAEGCGKTLMARLMEAVLGTDNVALVNNDAIRSQWNDWAFGSQVIVASEIYVSGKTKLEIMNRLKDLVTDDRITINKRNTSSRTVTNRANYFMFTNHHDALMLMEGSRRYFIVKSALQTEEQVLALGVEYFDKLSTVIHNDGSALRAFFEQWDIGHFEPDGRAPKTKYLTEMIEDGAASEVAVLKRAIKAGDHPLIQADLVASGHLMALLEMEGIRIGKAALGSLLRSENFHKAEHNPRGVTLRKGDDREHLWVRHGCLIGQDAASVARHRLETNYTTNTEEEEWV